MSRETVASAYHKAPITKGVYGKISKVIEELREFVDAKRQGVLILQIFELSDIYGALEAVAESYNLNMDELKKMSNLTKQAFIKGERK
jgi:hypothetical protein